jgi:hypothetical protein
MAVGADELDAMVLAHLLDVLLDRPAEGIVGDQQVPALGLGVGLHEVVHDGLRRSVGARRPLERIAMAARPGNVLGAAAEEVHHLLALGDLGYRERDARGPWPDDEARALAVDRLFRAPGGRPGLRAAVAGHVLDRLAEHLHAALLERHAHAAVVERPDVCERAGLVPQPEDHDFLLLRPHDSREAQARSRGADSPDLQNVSSLLLRHSSSSKDLAQAYPLRAGIM